MEIEPLTLDCAQNGIQEIPFKPKKLLYCDSGQKLGQVVQKGLGITILRGIKNLNGHSPRQSALEDLALTTVVGLDDILRNLLQSFV